MKFKDILVILLLWICCSSPLVLIGSFLGIKKKGIKNPCKVNPVPTTIPEQPWWLRIRSITLIVGIIPFA
jgi:transmembrane 9 superfamily protein 2/4